MARQSAALAADLGVGRTGVGRLRHPALTKRSLILWTAFALIACREQPSYVIKRLPSGRDIRVLGMGRVYSVPDKAWAIELSYETDLPIDDPTALKSEIDDIWTLFRVDAENSGLRLAAISANERPRGRFVTTRRRFGFVYEKGPDGVW